jgi:hypothetical protein
LGVLTDDLQTLLTEGSFTWEISGSNLTVSALGSSIFSDQNSFPYSLAITGIVIDGISLPEKPVTLRGMGGLANAVAIQSFDLPEDHPDGGIRLTLDTAIVNVRNFSHLVNDNLVSFSSRRRLESHFQALHLMHSLGQLC